MKGFIEVKEYALGDSHFLRVDEILRVVCLKDSPSARATLYHKSGVIDLENSYQEVIEMISRATEEASISSNLKRDSGCIRNQTQYCNCFSCVNKRGFRYYDWFSYSEDIL